MTSLGAVGAASLAGCLGGKERPYRGDVVEDTSWDNEELDPTDVVSASLPAERYSEIDFSANIDIPNEGYEDTPQIDILTFRNGNHTKWLNRETHDVISDGTIRNVDGEVERSFRVNPGYYIVLAHNKGDVDGRAVNIDFSVQMYNYYREESNVSCNSEISTEVAYLELDGDFLSYHIQIGETESEEYQLEMTVESEENEKSFSRSVESSICSTNFVEHRELDMDSLSTEDARVTVSVKDGDQNVILDEQGMVSTSPY